MRIVIDTNVIISGVFFGGYPRRLISAVARGEITAYASPEIVNEYQEIVREMVERRQGSLDDGILTPLISAMEIIEPVSKVEVCRDPDDDKFIDCARDARAVYIVSGDKDLLDLGQYDGILIITAKQFCEQYLS